MLSISSSVVNQHCHPMLSSSPALPMSTSNVIQHCNLKLSSFILTITKNGNVIQHCCHHQRCQHHQHCPLHPSVSTGVVTITSLVIWHRHLSLLSTSPKLSMSPSIIHWVFSPSPALPMSSCNVIRCCHLVECVVGRHSSSDSSVEQRSLCLQLPE